MYRPQFVYPDESKGCKNQRCIYSFDASNTPAWNGNIGAGAILQKIPLLLDQDADFFLRGIEVYGTLLSVGLEDAHGNSLLDPTLPGLPPTLVPALWSSTGGAGLVALESDNWGIFCPAGGVLKAYIQNTTAAPISGTGLCINLHGIKRYSEDRCK
jgi:hypothetical protein